MTDVAKGENVNRRTLRCALASLFLIAPSLAFAAISSPESEITYTANGTTSTFVFTFKVQATTQIHVFKNGTEQPGGWISTVDLKTQDTSPGGSITFRVADLLQPPPAGTVVRIARIVVPLTQELVLKPYSPFPAKSIEGVLDRLVMQNQQEATARAAADSTLSSSFSMGTPNASLAQVTATGGTTPLPLSTWMAQVVNVLAFGADPTGATDSSSAFALAVAVLPASGGTVVAPPGTFRFNLPVTRSNVTIRGAGRRATIFKPATNAAVITLSATAPASLQGFTLSDVGFLPLGLTSASPAILITGNGINDWHSFQRIYADKFTNAISITGRTIWSRFVDGEITGDLGSGVYVNTSEPVNHVLFESWRVAGSAGDGFYFKSVAGGLQGVFYTLNLHSVNSENNAGNGIYAENVDAFTVAASYIENNGAGSSGLRFGGTYARALDIHGNLIWGQGYGVLNAALWTTGKVGGNFLSNSVANFNIATSGEESHLEIGQNFESAVARSIAVDGNGRTHVSGTSPFMLEYSSETAAPTTARNKNMMRFTNAVPVVVYTAPDASPGQLLYVFAAGAGSVRIVNAAGGAGSFYLPNNSDLVLSSGAAATFAYDPSGTGWRPIVSAPIRGRNVLSWNSTMSPDPSKGELNVITATSNAGVTIGAAANQAANQKLTVQVRNTSGIALGTITWDASYKMAVWTSPANGYSRSVTFMYDGTNWIEVGRTPADVPN